MAPQPLPTPGLKLERLQRYRKESGGSGVFTLIEAGTNAAKIKSINFAPSSPSTKDVEMSIAVLNGGINYFIIRDFTLEKNTRFFLDMKDIKLNTTVGNDSLVLILDESGGTGLPTPYVNVIIST
tara:strand:+ start:834 stop:1208 length:375 start_codon:yes stop_codon:yes gene_type:complete